MLRAAARRGLLPSKDIQQVIDSTHVLGAGAVQDTYTLICRAIKGLQHRLKGQSLRREYTTKNKPKIDWGNPEERSVLLRDLFADAQTVLAATEGLSLTPKERRLREILATVLLQDLVVQEDGMVTLRERVAKDRVISVTDPEMRHGHKSRSQRFDGYKAHTAVEKRSELIVSVEVTPGNAHDSTAAKELVDSSPEKLRPGSIIADTAYGTGEVRAEMKERGIKVISPAPAGKQRPGRLSKAQFKINMDTESCICPAGQVAAEKSYSKKSRRLKAFVFSPQQCGNCALKGQCLNSNQGQAQGQCSFL